MSMITLFRKKDTNEFDPNFFIPEELLKDPKYKPMSGITKMAFILILDRFKKSKLKDEMGNVYCEFTIQELIELLQRCKSSVIRIKKELIKYELIEQEYVIGKPSRLYVKER